MRALVALELQSRRAAGSADPAELVERCLEVLHQLRVHVGRRWVGVSLARYAAAGRPHTPAKPLLRLLTAYAFVLVGSQKYP